MDDVTVICSIVIKDPALLCEKKKKTTTTTSAFTAPRHDDVKPAMNQEPKKKTRLVPVRAMLRVCLV